MRRFTTSHSSRSAPRRTRSMQPRHNARRLSMSSRSCCSRRSCTSCCREGVSVIRIPLPSTRLRLHRIEVRVMNFFHPALSVRYAGVPTTPAREPQPGYQWSAKASGGIRMSMTNSSIVASQRPAGVPSWKQVFITGLVLWFASVLVTGLTSNLNMIPTVILLGSFLVPATAVVWYLDHYQSAELNPWRVLSAFLVGGVLGVLAASILEAWLLNDGLLVYLGVGFLEEFAKLLALLIVARGIAKHTVRDGIVLGAAVGFGFAALESSGYAFSALLVREGSAVRLSLGSLVFTELLRGILAPVGHGLWTGILGGVVFGASRNGHLRLTPGVIGTFILVSLLHGLWDSMRGIALLLATLLTATPVAMPGVGVVLLPPPPERLVSVMTTFEIGGLVLVSLIGLVVLWRPWRTAPSAPATGVVRAPAHVHRGTRRAKSPVLA